MKHYEVTREIDASPEEVWAVLTDLNSWTSWDSGVVATEGTIAPGNKIKVTSAINPKRAFPVKVAELNAPRKMVWVGGMPLGLFKGERTFSLSPSGSGTHFRMREEFSGPMLGLIWKSMPDLQPTFEQFADGLAAQAKA